MENVIDSVRRVISKWVDVNTPIVAIQGQNQWGTLSAAQNAAKTLHDSFDLSGLPLSEMASLGVIIVQTSNAYTNTPKARFRPSLDGGDYEDYRQKTLEPSLTTNFAPGVLSGSGNPNGIVVGELGQSYYDTLNSIWYKCNATDSTIWVVEG